MAVVRRRPVPSSNDYKEDREKEIEKKPKQPLKEFLEERQRAREKEQERVQQEECNQELEEELIEESEVEMVNDNQDMPSEHNLKDFTASRSKTIPRIKTEAGAMSVVNWKNCKRITLSKDVMNKLNITEMMSMSFADKSLAVAERLPNNDNQLKVKTSGNKGVIYSAGLVSEITDKYGLDFSSRTSITFTEVSYVENNGYTVAIIKIK